jgi:DNA-binding response OmpR family regulator
MMKKLTDGFDLCSALKHAKAFCKIPVLMVTAVTGKTGFKFSPATDSEYLQADEYVTKPIPVAELLARVSNLIGTCTLS